MRENITAVCISRQDQQWHLPELPFHCYTKGWKPFGHEKSKERIAYLADRRNRAVEEALLRLPRTEHILMIDSYYLSQHEQIRRLAEKYEEVSKSLSSACILGASTWIVDKTRLRSRIRFFDSWTTPEGLQLITDGTRSKGEVFNVKAVGGCYLYPRSVWENVRYGVPEDLHGCEHNWLCEGSGMPVLLSMGVQLWHEPIVYPWPKRIRVSLHLGRLLGR